MYLSKYNIVEKIGDHIIIYNTVSGGVLKLTKDYEKDFLQLSKENFSNNLELIEILKYGNMLIEDNVDEVELLKSRHLIGRFNTQRLMLTIAPTLNCNFACSYCFEEGYRNSTMDQRTQDAIIDFVQKYRPSLTNLRVSWYGGEPLLALDSIENLTNRFINLLENKIAYSASILSNGYNLTKEVARKLRELYIDRIHITIDGNRQVHDQRRMLINGEGTYERIIGNIKETIDIIPITIRINVDYSNIKTLDTLLDEFDSLCFKNKINFYIAPVDDIFSSCKNPNCMSGGDYSKEEVEFYNLMLSRGFNNFSLPVPNISNCGGVVLNSFVIDPLGNLYKCWNHVGNLKEKVGTVFEGPQFDKNLTKWLAFNPFDDQNCKKCKLLPICMGGCPLNKLINGTYKCKPAKYNLISILNLIYRC